MINPQQMQRIQGLGGAGINPVVSARGNVRTPARSVVRTRRPPARGKHRKGSRGGSRLGSVGR